jgi:hypothetical protein
VTIKFHFGRWYKFRINDLQGRRLNTGEYGSPIIEKLNKIFRIKGGRLKIPVPQRRRRPKISNAWKGAMQALRQEKFPILNASARGLRHGARIVGYPVEYDIPLAWI